MAGTRYPTAPFQVKGDFLPFTAGKLLATPGAVLTFQGEEVAGCLNRHLSTDWGDVCPEDWTANDCALIEMTRLVSSYKFPDGRKLWVITEADRSATTVLLPEEY